MINYCIWFYDINNKCYKTGCCNQEISEDDYIGKYCTCCGKKIFVPTLKYADKDTLQGWLAYAT